MAAGSKWEPSYGRYVEDLMVKHTRTVDYEHVILDPTEARWEGGFSPENLDYVKTHNTPAFPDVSPTSAVEKYLSSFTSEMDTYDRIMTHVATHQVFQCNEDFGVTWARQSITNHMMNYAAKKQAGTPSEIDIILRTWSPLIYSFDDTAVRVQTAKNNSHRTLNERKLHGSRVDMRFLWDNFELGCSEVGKDDKGKYATKEMKESQLKCPKTLRDMLAMLSISFPGKVPKLKTFAYIMMGNTISLEVMDCPKKYVCRITRSPRFTFSDDIEAYVTRTLPILRLYLATKRMMLEVVEALRHSAFPPIALSPNISLPVPFAIVSLPSEQTSSSMTSSPSAE
ncbi:hypothetical protein BJV82DRAFT_673563 [Fennellomyces sp. T-0311]|nr:hypothetical protein BJV82DRAFT_673563 [Fennellomyces sp. T-0311]